MMNIPGISVMHCIITDHCRHMHGSEGALDEAFERIKKQYQDVMEHRSRELGVNYHIVFTVEDTKGKGTNT